VDRLACAEQLASSRPGAVAELWSRSGVPARFRGCSFDTFQPRPGVEKALASCRSYAESFSWETGEGLWLIGAFGTGKTHLAAAIGRVVMERCLAGVMFTTAADLVAAVRPAPGERDFNWDAVDDAICAELLILDDVGQEQSSSFARDVIYRVLNGRYEMQRPLILTSNAGDEQLEERLGGAAVSRLYEMTQPLILKAKDYRQELARSRSAA
jgi:DNA replication protein DnaC